MIYILSSTIIFGFLDALWKPIIDQYGHIQTLLHRTVLTTLLIGLCFIVSNTFILNYEMIAWSVLSGLLAYFGLFYLTKAFYSAGTSIIVFLNIITVLISQFTSLFLFEENINTSIYLAQVGGSCFAIVALNKFSIRLSKGIRFGLIASLCFGIAYPIMGIPIPVIGNLQATFFQEFTVLLMIMILALKERNFYFKRSIFLEYKILLLAGLTCTSLLLYFYAYTVIPIYKVNLISNFYPVSAMATAYFLFNEKIEPIQYVGIIIAILVLLSLY